MTDTKELRGWLNVAEYGDTDDALLCEGEPVAEWAEDNVSGHKVTVRYWTSDIEAAPDEIKQRAAAIVLGAAEAEWRVAWSEVTGYLWTDMEFKVGGHDLLAELATFSGQYLLLEVEIHDCKMSR